MAYSTTTKKLIQISNDLAAQELSVTNYLMRLRNYGSWCNCNPKTRLKVAHDQITYKVDGSWKLKPTVTRYCMMCGGSIKI